MAEEKIQKKNNKNVKKPYIFAVGRRREAVARVRLYSSVNNGGLDINGIKLEKGDILVNGKPINDYFRFKAYIPLYMKLLNDAKAHGEYSFTITVRGGGLAGQLDAVILGMARVLGKLDKEKYRNILKPLGYFTRDARVRERRKVGMGGKARRKRQSPKR